MSKAALLIFAKNTQAGKVKTRLAATMGDELALIIYKQLLTRTASVTKDLTVDKFVFYSNYVEHDDVWNSRYYVKQLQYGKDLGERMKNAFAATFRKEYNRVVIIGTDCPDLNEEIIMHAFTCLKTHDVVLGPAEDGGYYLLGMNRLHPALFENIHWSTNTVLDDTIQKCEGLRLTHHLLPMLKDIDEEKDLGDFKLQHL